MSDGDGVQTSLVLPQADVLEYRELARPENMVYSTGPRAALTSDGKKYVCKGLDDPTISRTEAACYRLAERLHIPVPDWSLLRDPASGGLQFGSEMVLHFRDIDLHLSKNSIANREQLPRVIAFDVWVCNWDRNAGNLITRRSNRGPKGHVDLVAIDFEKAVVFRSDHPFTETGSIEPSRLWPTGSLGSDLAGEAKPEDSFFAQVAALSRDDLRELVLPVETTLGLAADWTDSVVELLSRRAIDLQDLVEEVWQ